MHFVVTSSMNTQRNFLTMTSFCSQNTLWVLTRESSYCFQHVLVITILSVRLSVTRVNQSKTVQARIAKSSLLAA